MLLHLFAAFWDPVFLIIDKLFLFLRGYIGGIHANIKSLHFAVSVICSFSDWFFFKPCFLYLLSWPSLKVKI